MTSLTCDAYLGHIEQDTAAFAAVLERAGAEPSLLGTDVG
jgi:hypothetical protein